MDNPILDIEDARARLEAWKEHAEQRAAETQAASEGIQALRVTAADDNGVVAVTVDSTGALVDLRLSSRIQRQSPEYTEGLVLEVYRKAKARLADAAAEVVRETIGADSLTGRAMLAGFTRPEAPEQER